MFDIRREPELIEVLNAIINNKGIAEVKLEKNGITIVEIKRTLKNPKSKN